MKRASRIQILLLVSLLCAPEALAHKYHTSVTRVEYNAAERSAEVTIQTFADDLEAIITKRAGKNMRLDASKEADQLVFDYLQSVFELKRGARSNVLEWVGMEVKGGTVWIYVLVKAPEGLSKVLVRNTLLFDLFEDQVNIVNVLYSGKKNSLVFKRGGAGDVQEIP